MGIICNYCGASSTTNDKCSNCGAPIAEAAHPLAARFDKLQHAIHHHLQMFNEYKISRRYLRKIVTNIYVDDMLAFRIISNPKKVGLCKVKSHPRILDGLNKCSAGSKLSHVFKQYLFGYDEDDFVYTLSDIISTGAGISDENRIRFETKRATRVLPLIVAIPLFMGFIIAAVDILINYANGFSFRGTPAGDETGALRFLIIFIVGALFCCIIISKPKTLLRG